MNSLFLFLFLFLTLTAAVNAKEDYSFEQLDQMIIKSCSSQSGQEDCKDKLKSIHEGLLPENLLSKAPKLPIDSSVQITLIKDPAVFLSQYYCLTVFNHIINSEQIEPDIFPYVVYGFSFNGLSLTNYQKWSSSKEGIKCNEKLKQYQQKQSPITSNKKFNIILNPITFLENGSGEEFLDIAARNYNHERLHAIYAYEKAKLKTKKLWQKLSLGEQEQFISEHTGYDFKQLDILYREFFSYTFERSPEMAYSFLKEKKEKNYSQIKKELCTWCLADNQTVKDEIEKMAQLPPKDLLTKIEAQNIRVLILSAKRKNPLKGFYWGQLREDPGTLNQISKLEGAMGKTLCKNERPEAATGTTIILASDSPYSTLLHEYLHFLQIRNDSSWCPVSKRLWSTKPLASDIRMIRDREWDVRLVLWNLLKSPQMNIEDQIIVAEGLTREAQERSKFDPDAIKFLTDNKIQEFFVQKINEYKQELSKKN